MDSIFSLIGFGEAGSTFATAGRWNGAARVYDIKTESPSTATAKRADYRAVGVDGRWSLSSALADTPLVLSLVTADQALEVARSASGWIEPGAVFCDFNSVAPQTKRAAAQAIEAAGASYIDVAVMAPVEPARMTTPLLLSGRGAHEAEVALAALGFVNQRVVGDAVGRASSIKMIRSVIVKGIEALSAECVLAAEAAGVLDEVLASLDASDTSRSWRERADYNLDRMMVHGRRRAAEMEEVVATLEALGTGAKMTSATVERQRRIGVLDLASPANGLAAKIAQICTREAS